jgi:hypothetical protein
VTQQPQDKDVVWESTVDGGTWRVWVTGDPEDTHRGRLRVARVADSEVILDEEVGLAYGAQFGPDIADVVEWQQQALDAIDVPRSDTTAEGTE